MKSSTGGKGISVEPGAWPPNGGLAMTYLVWPTDEFDAFRSDVEGNVLRTLYLERDLDERVRAGDRRPTSSTSRPARIGSSCLAMTASASS
ncbi:MAG: hypothetical protein ACRDHS_05750 [Actinomycetota bacterium]